MDVAGLGRMKPLCGGRLCPGCLGSSSAAEGSRFGRAARDGGRRCPGLHWQEPRCWLREVITLLVSAVVILCLDTMSNLGPPSAREMNKPGGSSVRTTGALVWAGGWCRDHPSNLNHPGQCQSGVLDSDAHQATFRSFCKNSLFQFVSHQSMRLCTF